MVKTVPDATVKIADEIRDANLGLISSIGRMLDEAERVREYRTRLLKAIRLTEDRQREDRSDD
jgi:hypothetical protein